MAQLFDIDVHQRAFDALGPTVRTTSTPNGRTVHFIDEGESSWKPLLFFGGAGTTVRSFGLMEFARTLREQLGIRVVSVERNGLGQTVFDPSYGFREYADDIWALLDGLGIAAVSIVAASGGGPYAAWVAKAQPERVRSIHLACAWAQNSGSSVVDFDADSVASDPVSWWEFSTDSSVHQLPGFVDSTIEEATRAVFAQGTGGPPQGLNQAFTFYDAAALPDLTSINAPAFLYWGADDQVVPAGHLRCWTNALADVQAVRIYRDEGHDVQYRHWDQILTDVAHLGERIIVCHDGRTVLASRHRAAELLDAGATLGLGAWV